MVVVVKYRAVFSSNFIFMKVFHVMRQVAETVILKSKQVFSHFPSSPSKAIGTSPKLMGFLPNTCWVRYPASSTTSVPVRRLSTTGRSKSNNRFILFHLGGLSQLSSRIPNKHLWMSGCHIYIHKKPLSSLTWQCKIPILNRKYIFKWWMFHCHVSFRRGTIESYICWFLW